jgi:hypothetical protein
MKVAKKVQLAFDEEALLIIARVKAASGASNVGEVLRAALGLYDWALEKRDRGYVIGAVKSGEPVLEAVLQQPLVAGDSASGS